MNTRAKDSSDVFNASAEQEHATVDLNGEATSSTFTLPEDTGRYTVLGLLDEGGMGYVYRAQDTELNRTVAIKFPRVDHSTDTIDRFKREAQAMASVTHPNMCPIYEVGAFGDTPYFSMALIEGKTLQQTLKEAAVFPLSRTLDIVRKLALAVAAMADANVVHRDLKLANVMLTSDQEPVILDFGLAVAESHDSRITNTGIAVGTPAYMSPEQVEGDPQKIGPPSDVYSLGVILFELLTGRLPFEGSPAVITAQVLRDDPPAPSSIRADLDPRLDALCLQALSKQPEDRVAPRGMAEVLHGLYLELFGSQSMAIPARPAKPVKPSPRSIGASGIALALAALILGGGLLAGIVVIIRNKDGSEKRITVPEGATVTIAEGEPKPDVAPEPSPVAPLDEPPEPDRSSSTDVAGVVSDLQPIKTFDVGERVTTLLFDPVRNQCFLNAFRGLRAFDLETGEFASHVGTRGGIFNLSPTGEYAIVANGVGNKTYFRHSLIGEGGRVFEYDRDLRHIEISPDGKLIVAHDDNGDLAIYDAPTGDLKQVLEQSTQVKSFGFSADGATFLGSSEGTFHFWNTATGKQLGSRIPTNIEGRTKIHNGVIIADNRLAYLTSDGVFSICSIETGKVDIQKTFTARPHLRANPGGDRIVVWSEDYAYPIQVLDQHGKVVANAAAEARSVDLHPDNRRLITGDDSSIQLWRLP